MRRAFKILENENAHIPFISNYGTEFCHLKISGRWKAHYFNGKEWKRLNLPNLPADCIECQISSHKIENTIFVSLIVGYSKLNKEFERLKLVWFKGESLETLHYEGGINAIAGYLNGIDFSFATVNFIYLNGKKYRLKYHSLPMRISYDPSQPQLKFFTLGNGEEFDTYMLKGDYVSKLLYRNRCLYKMCSFSNEIYFAEKIGDERRIVEVENTNLLDAIPCGVSDILSEFK